MVDIDEKLKLNNLLDLYSCLLTEKQQEALKLFYRQDCSLTEIGEILHISRQGVFDAINIGQKALLDLESKLGIYARNRKLKIELSECFELVQEMPNNEKISKKIKEILENL